RPFWGRFSCVLCKAADGCAQNSRPLRQTSQFPTCRALLLLLPFLPAGAEILSSFLSRGVCVRTAPILLFTASERMDVDGKFLDGDVTETRAPGGHDPVLRRSDLRCDFCRG